MAKKTGSFPWERLDGEGEKPYQAFVLYRVGRINLNGNNVPLPTTIIFKKRR